MKIARIILIVILIAFLTYCKTTSSSNNKPNPPTNPTPADGAIEVDVDSWLTWECTDPEGDALTYDVYLGTNPNPGAAQLVAQNLNVTQYLPNILGYATTYFWKIVADDGKKGTQSSDVWEFTTEGLYEDFSDGLAQNFVFEDGRWSISGGNLWVNGYSDDTWASAYYNQEFTDFAFETRGARIQSNETLGNSYGVFFRSTGFMSYDSKSANGYLLSVTSNGYYSVWLEQDGEETSIIDWTYNDYIGYGLNAFNKIEIYALGADFDIYINDYWVDSFTDATYDSGYITLVTYDDSDGVNEIAWQYYEVDDLMITKDIVTNHTPHPSENNSAIAPK